MKPAITSSLGSPAYLYGLEILPSLQNKVIIYVSSLSVYDWDQITKSVLDCLTSSTEALDCLILSGSKVKLQPSLICQFLLFGGHLDPLIGSQRGS